MPYGLASIAQRQQARALKRGIKQLIQQELEDEMDPWWFISFHYNDGKTNEDQAIKDMGALKNKLKREIYRRRDRRIKGAGSFLYPKILVTNEVSHLGTGQFHSHLITEALPEKLNSQRMMELLFKRILPSKVKALSRWKSVDVQWIHQDPEDLKRLASYLGKQVNLDYMALDGFNSDFSKEKQ
ncbi:hypothetical protein OMCYN_01623 [cyanobiont of Ornithocercus magnificus]|nr:hypothetical protein OMCYN_01623 [cyanobiont of Ornithocercus magnificus]